MNKGEKMPKVSILMPACNVEKYLHECMDSVIKQTLKDIEIICIDDGSKDSTGEILDDYAKKDERVKVIHKVNTGYGHSMNVGLQNATGEYIGIVETDDYVDPDMFEKLYEAAKKYDADIVKSNYYTYVTNPEPKSTFYGVLEQFQKYDEVFEPLEFQEIYRVQPCIWTAVYRKEMLKEYGVWFNETPGASYQDTAFAFKAWTSAKRAVLVKDAFLHYRIDNANSSVKSTAKIFCICDEYNAMYDFLKKYPEKEEKLKKVVPRIKYGSYSWNYGRLTLEYKYHFLMRMKAELMDAREKGNLDKDLFNEAQWKNVTRILDDSDGFFRDSCKAVMKGQESAADLIEEYVRLREIEKQYVVLKKNQESLQEKYDNLDKNHKELKKQVNRYLPNRMKRFLKRILKKIKFR